MRLSILACVSLAAAILQPVASSNTEGISSKLSSVDSVASEGDHVDRGWGIFEPLLDKAADALHEGIDSLSASAHKLYDGLHLEEVGESLWDKITELSPSFNADRLFHHAMELHPSEKVMEFKASVNSAINTAQTLHQVVLVAADQRGIPVDSMKEELGGIFNDLFERLKEQLPPPEGAPSHENRTAMVKTVLDSIEDSFLQFTVEHGLGDESLKNHTSYLKHHIQSIVVTVGDFVEQHPELAMTLLFATIAMLLPEFWLVRQLLHIIGFGPKGPIKGTIATWLQGWLFRSAIPKGGWFAMLQRLAMTAMMP